MKDEAGDTTFTLTPQDMALCRYVAGERHGSNVSRGRMDTDERVRGASSDDHLTGVIGEYAFAQWRGLPWWAPCTYRGHNSRDVGDWHVRTTTYASGCLVLHDEDDRMGLYALAVVVRNVVRFPGWTFGTIAMRPRWWTQKNPKGRAAYFLPQRELRSWDAVPTVARQAL